MRRIIFLFIFTALIISCADQPKEDPSLKELFTLMQGSFHSEAQSKQDSSYYNISLHMYPIWKDRGNYLYVEQALFRMQDKPYRQRIYEISKVNDSTYQSAIYTIPNDSLWIGKWKTPEDFNRIATEYVTEKEGCEVLLTRVKENHFQGSTGVYTCMSTLRGASYATSEVEIFENKIISWDRGFDAEGNYVWGAKKGGYVFEKVPKN